MPTAERPELIISSRTQSAETIQKILDATYDDVETHTVNDQAEPEPEPAAEPAAEEPAPEPVAAAEPGTEEVTEEETPPAAEAAEPKPHKKGGFVKKITRLETENQRLKQELEQAKATKPADKTAVPLVETKPPEPEKPKVVVEELAKEPVMEDFATYEEYVKALGRHTYREERRLEREQERETREREETERQSRSATEAQTRRDAELKAENERWATQVNAAKTEHEDWDEVMTRPEAQVPMSASLVTALKDSDQGAHILHYLLTHEGEVKRISEAAHIPEGMSQLEQRRKMTIAYREVEKIEKLLAEQAAAEPTEEDEEVTEPPEASGEPPIEEEPAAAKPAVRAAPVAAAPAPVSTTPKPKPITPVGSRGITTRRKLSQLTAAEMRALPADEYRRRAEAEAAAG